MRHIISTALVAIIVSLLTVTAVGVIAQEPAQIGPAAVKNINAHKVDGRHAVRAGASKAKRAGRLVATDKSGYLPSNIVKPKWDLISGKPAGFADGVDNQGISGLKIVKVESAGKTVPANGVAMASVDCPFGSRVTGGGYVPTDDDLNIYNSSAVGNIRWEVWAKNYEGTPKSIKAVAMCLSTTPGGAISAAKVKGASTVTKRGTSK